MENIQSIQINKYKIKIKNYEGKKHMVVPVVMMTEGVHNGSKGAIYHCEEELSKNTNSWNGIPITIGHPKNDKGYISANSPEVVSVGKIFNTCYSGKLKAEAWIDIEKIGNQSAEALEYIKNGRALDVSVGVFSDDIEVNGKWGVDEEDYIAKATNYRPDHLALLPGESGACSWKDGCGIRVNSNGEEIKPMDKLQTNKKSYTEIMNAVSEKLREGNNDSPNYVYHYCIELYDDEVIYEKSETGKTSYYKQSYAFKNGEVEFVGNPIEVEKQISYVPKMQTNQCTKCEEKIILLVNSEKTNFSEGDKEWLNTMSEEQLIKLFPKLPTRSEIFNKNRR